MTGLDLDPPTLVDDAKGMSRLIEDLDGQGEIAVDTEADSFFRYREKVCLVQITVEDRDYLVDPLADSVDLGRLGGIFADPQKTKVFHDSEYDVLILKKDYGFEFAGLFDTRVAAAALGMSSPGLASVLLEHFGIELDKSQQRSDWARRPLTPKQICYAQLDTHYLLPLMHELERLLEERGRTMILAAECTRLEALEPPEVVFRPDDFVRIKGARALRPIERQAMRELFVLRERYAEEWDVPPFRVMNNQVLVELSQRRPRSVHALARIHGFSPRMARRMGQPVLDALERARELGPLDVLPSAPRKDGTEGMGEQQLELFDRLKRWRKTVADRQGIESSYLLNRHVMAHIARERPGSGQALETLDVLDGWQREMFGAELVAVLERFASDVREGSVPRRRPWRKGAGRK